jgi:hypothetical protein
VSVPLLAQNNHTSRSNIHPQRAEAVKRLIEARGELDPRE